MKHDSKIYLAGHRGLVGSAIHRKLTAKGYNNIITRKSKDLDLRNQQAVEAFFEEEKPEYVILAAAKVGGIIANNTYRAQFLYENIQIQNNVIHQSYRHGVKKLMFLGSSCIYPKNCPQPMKEDYLLTDELEYTNEPYAIAKIAGMKMCEAYNIQYGTNFISVMPTNLYGPNDNYDLETSHVLPALIRKIHLGKCLENNDWESIRNDLNKNPINHIDGNSGEQEILDIFQKNGIYSTNNSITQSTNNSITIHLWGSGNPRREFLHSEDMADACLYLMENTDFTDLVQYAIPSEKKSKELQSSIYKLVAQHHLEIKNTHINIGTGKDISIKELAEMIKDIVGFKGTLDWNTNMPDGTYQKLLDVSKLKGLGWQERIGLKEGIEKAYTHYKEITS